MKWILNGSAVLVSGIVLFVSLGMTQNMVEERGSYATQAQEEVRNASDRTEWVTTPYLVLTIKEVTENLIEGKQEPEVIEGTFTLPWIPTRVFIKDKAQVERRERSIYPVFLSVHRVEMELQVEMPRTFELKEKQSIAAIHWVWPMKKVAGIWGEITLKKGDTVVTFAENCMEGLCSKIPETDLASVAGKWSTNMDVGSTDSFGVEAMAISMKQTSESTWPHVSFHGNNLPSQRKVSEMGFTATFEKASEIRSNFIQQPNYQIGDGKYFWKDLDAVRMATTYAVIAPVSTYSLSDRATKYGYLFIMLVLGAMFFVQMDTASHPLAYGLVGASVVLFFVLLLALAEHVHFGVAYAIATVACLGANTYYLTGIFESWKKIFGILGVLGSFFGALYVILQSEDSALLIGSVFMFGCLLLAMSVARRKSLQVNFIGGNQEHA